MRDNSPEIDALVDSQNYRQYSVLIFTVGESPIYLSTARRTVVISEEERELLAYLGNVRSYKTSLQSKLDQLELEVQNVDKVFGQAVSGAINLLVGAFAEHGVIFEDRDTGDLYYDPKFSGDVVSGDVDELSVGVKLISYTDSSTIAGRTFSSAFPWTASQSSPTKEDDPNDLIDPNPEEQIPHGTGNRYNLPIPSRL